MFCPKCGKEIDDDSTFCEECGAELKKENVQSEFETEEPNVKPTDLSNNTVFDKTKKSLLTKKMIIVIVSIFVALAVLITGIVISNNSPKGIKKDMSAEEEYNDRIVVGVSPDYEPFEYYYANRLMGFDIDLIRSIADYSDLNIKIVEVDEFDDLFPGLQSGKFDCIISAICFTDERTNDYGYTDVYYTDIDPDTNEKNEYVIYTAKDNEELINKLNYGISYLKNNSEINRIAEKYGLVSSNGAESDKQTTSSAQSKTQEKEIENGVLVIRNTTGDRYTYKSTGTYKFTAFTTTLNLINMNTGEAKTLRTFSSEETHSCSELNDFHNGTPRSKMSFTPDFSKMVAALTLEDGSEHVGWIDESGHFTDVSAKITKPVGDFGALITHIDACFSLDGKYFFFMDETNGKKQVKRVPLDNLIPDAVELMIEKAVTMGLNPYPDNTIEDGSIWYYYDANMRYPARFDRCYDWISEKECVGTGTTGINDDNIFKYVLSGVKELGSYNVAGWSSSMTSLVESVEGRKNWNPVVSPQKDKVAFFSKMTKGTDQSTYLFVVPISGGNPTKIATSFSFSNNTYLLGWK